MLVDPLSAHELTLEVLHDGRVDDLEGFQIIWNGDGRLEITSPSGSRRDVQAISARHTPEEFADASCSRIRIDLTGSRDAASVEYKIRLASGSAFSLVAFALRDGVPVGGPGPLSRMLTINGGVAGEFAPSVASVSQRPVGDGVRVSLSGVLMNRIADVRLLGRDSQIITPEWTAHGSDSITFQLPNDVAMRVRFVQARDAAGRGSVDPCDLRASVHPPVKNQILVRLHEGRSFDRLQEVAGVRDVDWAVRWAETPEGARRDGAAEKYPQFALVNLAENGTVPEVLAGVRARPEVYSADSLSEGELYAAPNDPRWPYQWTLHTNAAPFCPLPPVNVAGGSLNADLAWEFAADGPPVAIGILDSGISGDHLEMSEVIPGLPHMSSTPPPNYNSAYDPSPLVDSGAIQSGAGHGTPVAGIAAGATAFGDQPYSALSTASTSRYGLPVSLKCAFTSGLTVPTVVQALDALVTHNDLIRIANLSFGFPSLSQTERTQLSVALRRVFMAGGLAVAAIGNDNVQAERYPAGLADLTIAVGAVDWSNSRWWNEATLQACASQGIPFPTWGSNFGTWLDFMAPGGAAVQAPSGGVIVWPFGGFSADQLTLPVQPNCNFCASYPNPFLTGFGGTSAAAPHVSGAVAWLLHVQPELSSEDAGELLRATTTDIGPLGRDILNGDGAIDMWRATSKLFRPGTPLMNAVNHGVLDAASGLAVLESSTVTLTLIDSPISGQNNGGQSRSAVRYLLRGTATYPAYVLPPLAWVRRVSSLGADAGSEWRHHERTPWARVLGAPGVASTEFETYTYRLLDLDPTTTNVFYPSHPASAVVAFTILGDETPLSAEPQQRSPERMRVELRSASPGGRLEFNILGGLPGRVHASVFDAQGRRVANLASGEFGLPGDRYAWDGRSSAGGRASSGLYLVRVERAGQAVIRRFILVR